MDSTGISLKKYWKSLKPVLFTEIKAISPVCFYGYSTYEQKMFRPTNFLENTPLVMLQMFIKKRELGIILLENLTARDRPMKMLDKSQIMTTNQVRVSNQKKIVIAKNS